MGSLPEISVNKDSYDSTNIVDVYIKTIDAGLTNQELFCLQRIAPEDRGSVLDIGIGAGRTSKALSRFFKQYVGIDYSTNMINAAKALFPALDLRVMDARSLNVEQNFDCVFFSYNGIDYVDLKGRDEVLVEIKRVLKPNGYLIYSTHNLAHRRVPFWMNSFWVSELVRPWRTIHAIPARLRNRFRNFKKQNLNRADGIGFLNDPGHGFILITAYVDIPHELETLRRCGFEVDATIGNAKNVATYDSDDSWVYILARKR